MVSGLAARVFPERHAIEVPANLVAGLAVPAGRVGWQGLALCAQVDPDLFYPEKGESALAAKSLCARCDVRAACLGEALARREAWGVWGGLSARERAELLAAREALERLAAAEGAEPRGGEVLLSGVAVAG